MLIEDNLSVVYVLSNPSMPGLLKIGETSRDVETRVAELNRSTSIPTDFVIERAYEVNNSRSVEKQLHQLFSEYKVGKEFFELDVHAIDDTMGYETNKDYDLIESYFDIQSLTIEAIEKLSNFIDLNEEKLDGTIFLADVINCIENIQTKLHEHLAADFSDLSDEDVDEYISDCKNFLQNLARFESITSSFEPSIDKAYYNTVDDLLQEVNEEIVVFLETTKQLFELSNDELDEDLLDLISDNNDAIERFFENSKELDEISLNGLHYQMRLFQHSNTVVNLYLTDYT